MELKLDVERSALLVEDFQNEIVTSYAANAPGLLERAAAVVAGVRRARIPIIYVTMQFRESYQEVMPHLRSRYQGRLKQGSKGAEIHPTLAPAAGDILVKKRRTGPFSSSDLDAILRAHSVTTLIIMGIITSGCVLSTVRWASDIDYQLMVIADACHDPDPDLHRMLVDKVFPRQSQVILSSDLLSALDQEH